MTRRRTHHSRVVTAFVKIPDPLADGKIRCPGCSRVLNPTKTGGIRGHKDSDGNPCPVKIKGRREVHLDEMPAVVLPPIRKRPTRIVRPEGPTRLDAGSSCRECGKWLPGERSLCGACFAKRPSGGRR